MTERDPLISGLYREANHPEPPAGLDARIRAEAGRAVVGPARGRSTFWRRLSAPLAFAAVAVLAVAVSLVVEREQSREAVVAEPAKREAPAPAPGDALPAPQKSEPAAGKAGQAAPAPARSRQVLVPQAPASAPALKSEREAPRSEESQASRDSAKEAAPARPASAPEAPASAGAAAPAAAESRRVQEAAPAIRGEADVEDPAAWIGRIRTLLHEGRTDEARVLLARFRERFPGHPLPDDLQLEPRRQE